LSKLRATALATEKEAEIQKNADKNTEEITHETKMSDLILWKSKQLAEVEVNKFEKMMEVIGKETLVSIANAGPETQAKLLEGLGLQGYLLTDGKSPINLFNAAQGMLGNVNPTATNQTKDAFNLI